MALTGRFSERESKDPPALKGMLERGVEAIVLKKAGPSLYDEAGGRPCWRKILRRLPYQGLDLNRSFGFGSDELVA